MVVVHRFQNRPIPSAPPAVEEWRFGMNNRARFRNLGAERNENANNNNAAPIPRAAESSGGLEILLVLLWVTFLSCLVFFLAFVSHNFHLIREESQKNIANMILEDLQQKEQEKIKQIVEVIRGEMDAKFAKFEKMMLEKLATKSENANFEQPGLGNNPLEHFLQQQNVKLEEIKRIVDYLREDIASTVKQSQEKINVKQAVSDKPAEKKNENANCEEEEQQLDDDVRVLRSDMKEWKRRSAKIFLVNNSKNCWNTTASDLAVKGNTVVINADWVNNWRFIRTAQGFSTVTADNRDINDQFGYTIHYSEFKYEDHWEGAHTMIFLASDDFARNDTQIIGSYFYGIDQEGGVCKGGVKDCWRDASMAFGAGDTVGCGVMVIHKSVTEKQNCARCKQPSTWVFFTKNGDILGNPQPLPANDVPSQLYPTIVMRGHTWAKVTANFGQSPFLYAMPPALGLFAVRTTLFMRWPALWRAAEEAILSGNNPGLD